MSTRKSLLTAATLVSMSSLALIGCSGSTDSEKSTDASKASSSSDVVYKIGVIAKSNSNPVFLAAKNGAIAAGQRLSEEHDGVSIEILASGADGIAISCTDANLLTGALKAAVESGVVVVTFDSDAPESGRMAYYGVDDFQAGKEVMRQLAGVMNNEGKVAVLTGNPAATNLQARVNGVVEQAAEYEGIPTPVVYSFMPETATEAAAKMQQVQTANPDITGWALVGGWPLYTDNALDGIYESAKIVSMDPLPLPLVYAQKGQVQVLVGQPYFGWGEKSVEMIVDKLHFDRSPSSEMVYAEFDIVTTDNAEEFAENWKLWLGED